MILILEVNGTIIYIVFFLRLIPHRGVGNWLVVLLTDGRLGITYGKNVGSIYIIISRFSKEPSSSNEARGDENRKPRNSGANNTNFCDHLNRSLVFLRKFPVDWNEKLCSINILTEISGIFLNEKQIIFLAFLHKVAQVLATWTALVKLLHLLPLENILLIKFRLYISVYQIADPNHFPYSGK